jgi:LysM repeat protein
VRKWTLSACLVLAWSIILLVTASAGSSGHGRPAQANTSTASITQATPATAPGSAQATLDSESAAAMTVKPAVPAAEPAATWTVRPGDTLSAIAAALGVPGGWQTLYAGNRKAIGPDPGLIRPGAVLAVPGAGKLIRYTVAPGDTLSGIATALSVPGGWQTLYAGNRKAIGPDPGLIRPGTVLAAPLSAASSPGTHGQAPGRPPSARPRHQSPPAHGAPAPAQPSSHPAVPGNGTVPAGGTTPRVGATATGRAMAPTRGGMPGWLEDVLIAAGVLVATAFAAEPAAALARRRQAAPGAASGVPGRNRKPGRAVRAAAKKARIILADHERLVVTYCARDHTVYVLTPPGEDPRAVLRAARLVVPEQTYKQLAGHLGVPAAWPRE